jgi:hypothetical protein
MNIFDFLEEIGLCYAVMVSKIAFIGNPSDQMGQEYVILAAKHDEKRIEQAVKDKNKGRKKKSRPLVSAIFIDSKDKEYYTIEYNLTKNEANLFLVSYCQHFKKTLSNDHGSVWEMKKQSFKTYYSQCEIIRLQQEKEKKQQQAKQVLTK